IYSAVYSGIQVYEVVIKTIPMMRRAYDDYINATQILKLAGLTKPQRTKTLEREVHGGTHEKIQGGYGKYQGTWIPLQAGRELAIRFGVMDMMSHLFDF
ncbi:transcription regulator HTH, apses-type DNA-binding domain-containing protein, partial [Entophlyctis helioformis]